MNNLLKFSANEWVVIPPRNTVQEVLDIYKRVNLNEFKDLFNEHIIQDINGKPDLEKATLIINQPNTSDKELKFELYEIL